MYASVRPTGLDQERSGRRLRKWLNRLKTGAMILAFGASLAPLAATAQLAKCVASPTCGVFIEDEVVNEGAGYSYIKVRYDFEEVDNLFDRGEFAAVFWDFQSLDGDTAKEGSDYYRPDTEPYNFLFTQTWAGTSGYLEIPVGIRIDSEIESSETFTARLDRGDTHPLIKRGRATITIMDASAPEDEWSKVSMTAQPVEEGDGVAIVVLTLDRPTVVPAIVTITQHPGTAKNAEDFWGRPSGVVFSPGEQTKSFEIVVNDDDLVEGDESFTVRLKNPLNVILPAGNEVVTVTIIDDDTDSIGIDYADVPKTHWAYEQIKAFNDSGIAGRCADSPRRFCPGTLLRNDVLALWLLKAKSGAAYIPPEATGKRFDDIGVATWAANWVEEIDRRAITHGCGQYTVYCPTQTLTRAAFASALVRARYGADHSLPPATGPYDDVPPNHWSARYVEQLQRDGVITGGCNANPKHFCPGRAVTRAWAAWMIVRTFGL